MGGWGAGKPGREEFLHLPAQSGIVAAGVVEETTPVLGWTFERFGEYLLQPLQ